MFKDILEATGGRHIYGHVRDFSGISIDSRTIKDGELFIALKGLNFDGHDFIGEALKTGGGALLSIPPAMPINGKTIICVGNTLKALQSIAHYLRARRDMPVIGITGTNGKTTTKELLSSILGAGKYTVLKSTGNLNNQIGLPLSLAKIAPEHDAVVLEMGASMPGDIEELCRIASPDYGIITNIGHAHLEGFGDIETLRKTKLEMLASVRTVAVNQDDRFLLEGIGDYKGRVIRYGINDISGSEVQGADIILSERGSRFMLRLGMEKVEVNLNIAGLFNIYNALAASSIGYALGISPDDIKKGLEAFSGVPMRYEIKSLGDAMILSDVYNANPASMEEAVKELIRLRRQRAVAVLGDMLELGPYGETAHRKLGAWMSGIPVDLFIGVGPLMAVAVDAFSSSPTGRGLKAPSADEARRMLIEELRQGDTILVKGSRGMKMEGVLKKDAL